MVSGLDAANYAAASARVKGLCANLLPSACWAEMLAADGYAGVLDVIKGTALAVLLEDVEPSGSIALEGLEQRISMRAAEHCRRAMSLTTGMAHRLLHTWWQHYELENLKALFRGVEQGMDPSSIQQFWVPLAHSTMPWERLLSERTVDGLIDQLADTHYINPLRVALPRYQRDRQLFVLEVALDIRYYRDLAADAARLRGSDGAEARRLVGARLDILNILWAFRYRVYYGLSAEEIVNYTLWRTVRTDADLVRAIALGAGIDQIVARVWGLQAIDLSTLDLTDEATALPDLELQLARYLRRLAQRELQGYPFRIGALLGYLIAQESEAQDLVTMLEAKAMGWPPERIARRLVRGEE